MHRIDPAEATPERCPHQQILQALIKAGANPNLADKDGVRPLQHAKQRGYAKMVALLEAAGAR